MTKRAILDIEACLRPDGSQTPFNPTSVGGGKPILTKTLKDLCGNDGIVESMEKSSDFPTLLTMPWIPLRGTHIPTKTAVTFCIDFKSKSKKTFLQ
jgi:hypothetical protein